MANLKIDNFGQCGALIRSGHIQKDQYSQLKLMQIGTVVNLQAEEDDEDVVRGAGLNYKWLPLVDKQRPDNGFAPLFLDTISGPDGPYWVHCQGGRHRTGAAVAIYRIRKFGWDFDQAYEEMKKFGFYTWFGHDCFREYVYDFWRENIPADSR
jgi:protein tyrosine/serine phosphatase